MEDIQLQIEKLKKEIEALESREGQTQSFSFSKITFQDLKNVVSIDRVFEQESFSEWFNYGYKFNNQDIEFLKS